MRLIDADAFDKVLSDAQNECKKCGGNFRYGVLSAVRGNMLKQPTVNAVPLDKLCLLLHDIAGCPCYSQPGEDMCNRLIGDQCNTEWDDVECWKRFLTKWMEEQDAQKEN
jgi:hypothetical protein